MGKYHLERSPSEQFFFSLRAENGERILQSELYTRKASAQKGIASCRVNSADDANYERLTSKDNLPYFVLKAANGEVIGSSETYSSSSARETGIASCKANGPGSAEQDDTTG